MIRTVVTHHLELNGRDRFNPKACDWAPIEIVKVAVPAPEYCRFLYATVGERWYWIDRLQWSYGEWLDRLRKDEIETWVGYRSGSPIGYFELEMQANDNVEIVYFGLLPSFVGKGLGGGLLSEAVKRAWGMGAARVWLHTCTLDHPAALTNYRSRGFEVFKTESKVKSLPDGTSEVRTIALRSRFYDELANDSNESAHS
ncbi:MAG: GNAT family N-acetyltransferase [SAR324 cluster bacterium]|nr:GNAT family N-acetyltransferase [SAR324 cluster bacterium]